MKKFLFALGIILSVFLVFGFTNAPKDNQKRIEYYFNKHTTFDDLVMIAGDCKKSGILLTYKVIEYNDAGQLKSISFKVDCGDGFKGGASSDRLLDDENVGFYRDYDSSGSPFGTGSK